MARIVAGILLLAHGLVHMLYLAPDVTEFSLRKSWLVPEAARQPVGLALIAATIVASASLALAVWGLPLAAAAWPVVAALTGAVSLVLLLAYWDTRLMLGVAIDATLITLAIVQPAWLTDFFN